MGKNETKIERIREAYLRMAEKAKYRPQAPSDGFGHIQLSDKEYKDRSRLIEESVTYADNFLAEEKTRRFNIGVSDFATNRAFVYAIAASRLLCGGSEGAPFALKLLEMAADEVKDTLPIKKRA